MRRERTGSARRLAQLDETKPICSGRTKRRAKGGFLLYRARHVFFCQDKRKWGKAAKRRLWRSKRAAFEDAARLAGMKCPGIAMPRRCKHSWHRSGAFPAPKAALVLFKRERERSAPARSAGKASLLRPQKPRDDPPAPEAGTPRRARRSFPSPLTSEESERRKKEVSP